MKRFLVPVIFCAGAAFAAASFYYSSNAGTPESTSTVDSNAFDSSLPLAERIASLEKAVSDERHARQLLQEEVFYLTSELDRLVGPALPVSAEDGSSSETAESVAQNAGQDERRRQNQRLSRREMLVEAGFLPAQADWITQREQELQMQALQERFDAERSGEPFDWMASRNNVSDGLRQELGDDQYEQYLEATNRSTKISVSSVIESSPAQTAGLQPGDEIIRYGGERVFSMTDLTRQTMVGEPGQTVVVDVMRDGNLMQVVMPRGPVGITGGRRRY